MLDMLFGTDQKVSPEMLMGQTVAKTSPSSLEATRWSVRCHSSPTI